jgi:hypothetical protein
MAHSHVVDRIVGKHSACMLRKSNRGGKSEDAKSGVLPKHLPCIGGRTLGYP